MIPFTECPGCQSPLSKFEYLPSWFSQSCDKRCELEFSQHFLGGQEENVSYICVSTQNFNLYVYYETGYYPGTTYVYSKAELKRNGKASPLVILPYNTVDFFNLEKLDQKLLTLSPFA